MKRPFSSCAPGWLGGLGLLLVALLGSSVHALEWTAAKGHRWAALPPPAAHEPGFTLLSGPDTGITFTNLLIDDRSITNRNLLSGAGLACGDVDGDGWTDLFFCGIDSACQLYRNLGGWKFTNVTAAAFSSAGGQPVFGPSAQCTGAAFADVDGDGDLDLLVNSLGGGTRLFLNDGHGRFTEATDAAGLRSGSAAMSLALADVDGDGDLDLYVANFRPTTMMDEPQSKFSIQMENGRPVVAKFNGRPTTEPDLTNRFVLGTSGEVQEYGEAHVLWLNDGHGRFTAVDWLGGAFLDESGHPIREVPRDWGLACRFGDVDGDGRVDLYVCNDLWTPDRVWLNASTRPGEVKFRALSRLALRSNSTFSMGVDIGDLNRDGIPDLFTVDMLSRDRAMRHKQMTGASPAQRLPGQFNSREQVQRNALHLGRGDGTFAEIAYFAGVEASEWSWGPIFLDVDLDGYEDILITNGQLRDFQDSDGAELVQAAQRGGRTLTREEIATMVRGFPKFDTPNVAFRNRGGAVPAFDEVGAKWGFTTRTISQGGALADLDNDGDLDLVVNNLGAAPGLYRNEGAAARVAVRLRGRAPNTRGIGARIALLGREPVQRTDVIAGGRYLAGDDPVRAFAVPAGGGGPMSLEVRWASGRRSEVAGVEAGRIYEIEEPADGAVAAPAAPVRGPAWFEEVSAKLGHVHFDEPFDDFARQPLLPRRLSQLGPGVTWTDLNGDGWDDLVIGTGRGGPPAAYLNDGKGGFQRMDGPPFNKPAGRDLTTILPLNGALVAGSANYEDGQTNGGWVRVFDLTRKASGDAVLGPVSSVGPLAAADVDGDGALEIFVGGRSVAGRYPEAATSLLLKSAGGRLSVAQRFESLGMVSGACFTDLDGDGRPELVVALEWGPLRVFRNRAGVLEPWDPPVKGAGVEGALSLWTGWWNGVTAGDFDGDGRLDLVASNWGRNSAWRADAQQHPVLHFGNLGGAGPVDLFPGVRTADGREWPERELMLFRMVFPGAAERFPTYAAYSAADVPALLGDDLKSGRTLSVATLDSMVFLNRGDHFEARALPDEAQLAPAFALCVGDYDGDGHEDLFLSQNFIGLHPILNRADAGRGLWLRGDGRGGFAAERDAGVAAYGEQRGAALADFDGDGRVDLCVSQNASTTTLWRNVRGRPGLRVRLAGPAGNESGYGAAVRLGYAGQAGPWRELHAGAGYWSVDSPVVVLGRAGTPVRVEVRWPGGAVTRADLPASAQDVTVGTDGQLKVNR